MDIPMSMVAQLQHVSRAGQHEALEYSRVTSLSGRVMEADISLGANANASMTHDLLQYQQGTNETVPSTVESIVAAAPRSAGNVSIPSLHMLSAGVKDQIIIVLAMLLTASLAWQVLDSCQRRMKYAAVAGLCQGRDGLQRQPQLSLAQGSGSCKASTSATITSQQDNQDVSIGGIQPGNRDPSVCLRAMSGLWPSPTNWQRAGGGRLIRQALSD